MCIISGIALKSVFGRRCDGNPSLRYFSVEDFPGLLAKPVSFKSNRGDILCGYIYTHKDTVTPKALIIFSHGMFGGHKSYTTEINTFAKNGYTVLAFDNSGTFESEGKQLYGFYQGASDLRSAINFAETEQELMGLKKILVGHSWGGFSVLANFAIKGVEISGAVAFSPPESGYMGAAGMMGEKFIPLAPALLPAFLRMDKGGALVRASKCVLSNKKTKVMILHGTEDPTVPTVCSPVSNEALAKAENVTIIKCEGKGHNVYQTERSEKYMRETFAGIKKANRRNRPSLYKSIDYTLMTEEDPEVMGTVIDFLDGIST